MQIVIDIPEEDYNELIKSGDKTINLGLYLDIGKAVKKGTILPKNHGNLIDYNDVDNAIYDYSRSVDVDYGQLMDYIDSAPIIIEAEEE